MLNPLQVNTLSRQKKTWKRQSASAHQGLVCDCFEPLREFNPAKVTSKAPSRLFEKHRRGTRETSRSISRSRCSTCAWALIIFRQQLASSKRSGTTSNKSTCGWPFYSHFLKRIKRRRRRLRSVENDGRGHGLNYVAL